MVKKCLLSSVLCATLLGATAEAGQSGLFLGFGGTFSFGGEGIVSAGAGSTGGSVSSFFSGKTSLLGGGAELTVGYKTFFLSWLGLRGYASVDYSLMAFEKIVQASFEDGIAMALDTALNVDVLFDIIPTDAFSLGVFAGISGGMRYWHGPLLTNMAQITTTQNFFGTFGMNAGVSMGFGRRSNLEVFTKIPFLANEIIKGGIATVTGPYAIGLRFTFTFASGGSSINNPAAILE